MAEIKSIFNIYRERKCKIDNLEIEIENLRLSGLDESDIRIEILTKEINRLKNENKRIDNMLNLLPEKEYKVIKLVLIDCKDKKKAANEIDRTERQLNRILNRAVKKIVL
ncbi:RNA polymerase subunit sigma-70 [Clostridium sp. 2-1]|uniref:RNA polymerase subunit sigma-70 n=1 Tax=Clostridium TaxID=1485 RepID=UPI000CDA2E01|nr:MULTISPECIES: RNA polymerase subunit sigma-70 [Clostridium]MBN7575426.1 RNA polymerase subunit sigma-70 [Clostridium beijerinckii]MBN7580737.1 RNA polymerase subunit sigma-70 [Clostridium beijerinckii]MBN7585190.1 RNA polymerase subunit sigma-70 [Clostridium beijerinckii]MBO0522004.1 RNA polymerase subunit sigma-70 [Clostridium beijerinckii]POO91829.1 RNA polymerase subunit sigma-70 [Clostridium sp. 2-1]